MSKGKKKKNLAKRQKKRLEKRRKNEVKDARSYEDIKKLIM